MKKTGALESILNDILLRSERREFRVSSNDNIGLFRPVCDVSSDWNPRSSTLTNSGIFIFRPMLFSQMLGKHISKSFLRFVAIPSSLLGHFAVKTLT